MTLRRKLPNYCDFEIIQLHLNWLILSASKDYNLFVEY